MNMFVSIILLASFSLVAAPLDIVPGEEKKEEVTVPTVLTKADIFQEVPLDTVKKDVEIITDVTPNNIKKTTLKEEVTHNNQVGSGGMLCPNDPMSCFWLGYWLGSAQYQPAYDQLDQGCVNCNTCDCTLPHCECGVVDCGGCVDGCCGVLGALMAGTGECLGACLGGCCEAIGGILHGGCNGCEGGCDGL